MGSRKRTRSEVIPPTEEQSTQEPGLLHHIRNTWEFACLMQYIAIFGQVMKIDEEFEVEDLENECLKTEPSQKLLEIGLCLLKWISSHRGLTFDNFDEYTRRQYNAKAPHVANPFGMEEEPLKFMDFDVFQKLRVLHQLSVWTLWNPDRIRDKMPEKKESEQLQWRIEEFGFDRNGRSYYALDDNRLYRRTEPPIPAAAQRPKKKPKSRSSRTSRASKRASRAAVEEESEEENKDPVNSTDGEPTYKWECLAVTLPEYNEFLDTIRKSKDPDEKALRSQIEEHILPLLEQAEEAQQRKRMKREKEELAIHMIAGAKRSSRLAGKLEKERAEREAIEAAQKHEADLAEARREQAKQQQREGDRQSRMMTREQRIKDREQKRILHEAELERIAEEQEKVNQGESRSSARNLQLELEKSQKNLADLSQEDQWVFDCSGCGVYGENLDDGSHSVACEKCNVWQHSNCLGIRKEDAEKEDFHFLCQDCKQKGEQARLPKIPPLKFRLSSSASPTTAPPTGQKRKVEEDDDLPPSSPVKRTHDALSSAQGGAELQRTSDPKFPSLAFGGGFSVPRSPERRTHPSSQTPLPSSSPPRPTFSPPKGAYGSSHAISSQNVLPPMQAAPQLPPGPFPAVRPSSSHSGYGLIQNQPSMSPTQGNPDVGPLAGFPLPASNGNSAHSSFENYATPRPQSGHAATPAMSSNYPSFSATATPNGNHSSPPRSSHGMGLSGISPTKQSPRPMTSGNNGPGAMVLPPIRRLEPSPKLMGRSSPDAPIPPPVKCMTPEQEERRQRENASLTQQVPHYPAHGQATLTSSPSVNRFPPLGATTNTQPEPFSSPQRGGDASRQ